MSLGQGALEEDGRMIVDSGQATQTEILQRMQQRTEEYDWASLSKLAEEYAMRLHASATAPQFEVARVLDLLRRGRQYDALMSVADAALANDPAAPGIWRRYAQALIDSGRTAAALRIFTAVFEDPTTSPEERIEARGGMGRCYKQLYLTTTAPERRADYLRRSLTDYLDVYNEDRQSFWHGINAAALLTRAQRERIKVSETSDAGQRAREIAAEVLATVETRSDPWAQATACEACVALGDTEHAVVHGAAFVDDADSAFAIASLLRQLIEVWELDTTKPLGSSLLPVLRSALLEKDGGKVVLATQDVGASRLERVEHAGLEKVLGYDRYSSLSWYLNGLRRCQAVARIEDLNEQGLGTGFLVAGAALHPLLPQTVCVTNAHVIPEALDPHDAFVVFHGLGPDATGPKRFKITRQWWYEPSNSPNFDTTVLELEGYPQGVETIPVARRLPEFKSNFRVYIIGHPMGLEQPQFSLQDNLLLDYDRDRLHYRAPTEPGSSGSAVFDDQWQLIGLHHAGNLAMPRLNGKAGTYPANEALRIDAICTALATRRPAPMDVAWQ
jgi:V8-like Glu-specific endopeptidase